jgi:enamine deaminase RidA (YjgF/YER057c/UK114 family)
MNHRITVVALLFCFLAAATAEDRKHITDTSLSSFPFSNGVLVGDTLYIGGHLGLDPKTGEP